MNSQSKRHKIICIGNSLVAEDTMAMAVYDLLSAQKLPDSIELIEGGIAGLNLLSHLENAGNVVFVDTVSGFSPPETAGLSETNCHLRDKSVSIDTSYNNDCNSSGTIIILAQNEITEFLQDFHYGHNSGIAYLLSVLPMVCEGTLPNTVFLVGLEGKCSRSTIEKAALITLKIAINGNYDVV